MLFFSDRTVRQIKEIVSGRLSYIVPLYPSSDDMFLSNALQIPIFAGKIEKLNNIFNKSGAKKVFELCDIALPLCAWDINSGEELLRNLTILITNYVHVNTWVFKLNYSSNGRGIAYICLNKFKTFQFLKKDRLYGNLNENDFKEKVYETIKSVLN